MSLLTLKLPKKGKILVKEGQEILPGDLLTKSESSEERGLDIARLLKVKPQEVQKLLVKKIGEEVQEGEVLARKSGLFSKSSLKSPSTGVLEKLDEETGILTIKSKSEEFALKAKLAGKIAKIKDDEEIVIEFKGVLIEAVNGLGPQKEGKIVVLREPQVHLFALNLDLAGKIVAASTWDLSALSKAKALGVEAVLAQEVEKAEAFQLGETPPFLGNSPRLAILIFSPENFGEVLKCDHYQAWVWGDEKVLVITQK